MNRTRSHPRVLGAPRRPPRARAAGGAARRTVVLGFFGSTVDGGQGEGRWNKWRPSVAACRHDDLWIARFELLCAPAHHAPAALVARDIALVSPETEVRVHDVPLADPWDFEEVFGALLDFARAYRFDLEHERYLVHITTGSHVVQISWFLLTESRHVPAALLQTSPPRRHGSLEPGAYRVIELDLARYDRIAQRFAAEHEDGVALLKRGITTRNPAFNALIAELERVALGSRGPILLSGPTGAGKSLLARSIYALKRARALVTGPLVEVNCATLRGDGAMSALFGHEKGAFTGATGARRGLLRSADGGLLFLDEVGELGLDEQALLLRAIEEKRFAPLGSDREVTSDFELVAGTNRALDRAVRAGRFREDLLARIDLWHFELPGLAGRREDIEPNLDFELAAAGARLRLHVTMNREARVRFLAFATAPEASWPANFRDLGAAVSRMATLAPAGRIDRPTVEGEIARLERSWQRLARVAPEDAAPRARAVAADTPGAVVSAVAPPRGDDEALLHAVLGPKRLAALDLVERVALALVVQIVARAASLSDAGRRLYAASRARRRSTNDADRLRKYLARYGLSFQGVRDALAPS